MDENLTGSTCSHEETGRIRARLRICPVPRELKTQKRTSCSKYAKKSCYKSVHKLETGFVRTTCSKLSKHVWDKLSTT